MTTGDALGRMDSDTDADAAPDTDDRDIRARVAELEATVAQQQQTIQQLLPSRRRVLQAGGLVAGGGVLGALTADRASAQASGQVGTSSDPVDVEAFDLNVQDGATFNGSDISNVGSVSTGSVAVTDTLINSGLAYGTTVAAIPDSNPSDTSSSTFVEIASLSGAIAPVDEVPSGATLQGNLIVQANSVPSGETATYRAELLDRDINGGDGGRTPSQLEVQVTDTSNQESGWQDISGSFRNDGPVQASSFEAKVSSGTLSTAEADRQTLLLRWVVD